MTLHVCVNLRKSKPIELTLCERIVPGVCLKGQYACINNFFIIKSVINIWGPDYTIPDS